MILLWLLYVCLCAVCVLCDGAIAMLYDVVCMLHIVSWCVWCVRVVLMCLFIVVSCMCL